MTRYILTVLTLTLMLLWNAGSFAADSAVNGSDNFGERFGSDIPQALIDLASENQHIMLDYYDGTTPQTAEDLSKIAPAAGDDYDQEQAMEALERVRAESDGHVIIDRIRPE